MKFFKVISILIITLVAMPTEAQIWKKVKRAVKRGVERTVENRAENESAEATDDAIDGVLGKNKKKKTKKRRNEDASESSSNGNTETAQTQKPDINTHFDFVRGNATIFHEDFSRDAIGDFPAKWDTNNSGEIVNIDGQKYLKLYGESVYFPELRSPLPENYTLEFDLYTDNLTRNTSSYCYLRTQLDDNQSFDNGKNFCHADIGFTQYIEPYTNIERYENGKRLLRNDLKKDYREQIKGSNHISIMVNKTRFRLWIGQNKIMDIPKLVPKNGANYLKFLTKNIDGEGIYITNIHIAETGTDKRSQVMKDLIENGSFSTNEILFASGSDKIASSSAKILNEIGKAMQSAPDAQFLIIGHTDSDGDEATNQKLSQDRANAVKNYLTQNFGVDASKLMCVGKGESEPIANNNSAAGKAQNRRVEFKKL